MRIATALFALALLTTSGCAGLDTLFRPSYHASITPLEVGATAWNRDGLFRVEVVEADVVVLIEARQPPSRLLSATGIGSAEIDLPDGIWSVSYRLGGHLWGTLEPVRVDSTPPSIPGLRAVILSENGDAVLGEGAVIVGASTVDVKHLDSEEVIGHAFPITLKGLEPGLHLYQVKATDDAGNQAEVVIQVRVGSLVDLPAGQYDFGVVARYNNAVRLWDIRNLDAYLSPAAAQAADAVRLFDDRVLKGSAFLGSGYGITPADAAVRQVVDDVVPTNATTGQAAMALYRWMFDELEYDEGRLDDSDLLSPAGTITAGGGVCRDLAALYVSLLRAAGVPARLVTGYVAGNVNGFHAWVEFYGAPEGNAWPSPWVPVDVSPIDGPLQEGQLLFSFGIQLPEYLMLRQVPPSAEVAGWEAAGRLSATWPEREPEPDVAFAEEVTPNRTQAGKFCVNVRTLARSTVSSSANCPASTTHFLPSFTVSTERTIDYGIRVVYAPDGTTITASLAYPFPDSDGGDFVAYEFYGPRFTRDEEQGVVRATIAV